MDEHNVHHFHGISPAVDLLAVAEAALRSTGEPEAPSSSASTSEPLNVLQAACYDSRHTITTLCRLHRHAGGPLGRRPLHLYVYEEEPEVLLRHVLLLSVLLDEALLAKERMETLLELHSNALLRDNTAAYLDAKGKALEQMLVDLASRGLPSTSSSTAATQGSAGGKQQPVPLAALMARLTPKAGGGDAAAAAAARAAQAPQPGELTLPNASGAAGEVKQQKASPAGASGVPEQQQETGLQVLASLLDVGMLRFQDRDLLVEAAQRYRSGGTGGTAAQYDMVQAWDARARKWYKERYDVRRNMVDWDYHMPMVQAGTPGQPKEHGSVVHYHHFRHWRMHGVAYELRDARYNQPNRSMLSTAYGRTREFKDRSGRDVGRSVSAWGFWGDILNSPFPCWGVLCEDEAFYKFSNKQFTRTAVDIAERNVLALIHELRTGSLYQPGAAEPHRARAARGPTSLADLAEEAEKTERAKKQIEGSGQGAPASSSSRPGSVQEEEERDDDSQQQQDGQQQQQGAAASSPEQRGAEEAGSSAPAPAASQQQEAEADAGAFQSSATFQGPRAGYIFKRGLRGIGYYRDERRQGSSAAAAPPPPAPSPPATSAESAESSAAAADAPARHGGGGDAAASSSSSAAPAAAASTLEEEAAALRAAEASLDAAAAARLRAARVRIVPLLGSGGTSGGASELCKLLTGRAKFKGAFHVLGVGHRHVHLLAPEHKLAQASAPGAVLVVESAKFLLQLKAEQAEAFSAKVAEMAQAGGWAAAPAPLALVLRGDAEGSGQASVASMAVTDAHLLFTRAHEGGTTAA